MSISQIASGPPRRRNWGLWALIVLAALAVITPVAIWSWNRHLEKAVAEARDWTIAGPPCPSLTAKAYAAGAVRASREFQLGDVTFGRGYGHASCNFIAYDGGRSLDSFPVCQFTSPAVVHVKTPKGDFYFFPSTGPATVSVPHGQPECVMAANWRGD
jgi:hypothetical protein